MKKIVSLLFVIVIAATGCKNKKPLESTMLGEYTPYSNIHEKLNGKVQQVIEKFYWATPEGDNYIKGNLMTTHEHDSLNIMYDFGVIYDNSGDVVSSFSMLDNGKIIGRWDLVKENNVLTMAKRTNLDTLGIYHKFTSVSDGIITAASRYMPVIDTLLSSYAVTYNTKQDTQTFQSYNYKGVPTTKRIAVADKDAQFLNVSFYNKDGVYTGGHDIRHTDKGILNGVTYYDKDRKETMSFDMYNVVFDDHGNWISAVGKDKGTTAIIMERTISYFEK